MEVNRLSRQVKSGNISEIIRKVWKNSTPTSSYKPTLQNNEPNSAFLTEAYIEEKPPKPLKREYSYQELIEQVDSISGNFKKREDDLAELRRRISKCEKSLNTQNQNQQNIKRSAQELHSQHKTLYRRFKSYANLRKVNKW